MPDLGQHAAFIIAASGVTFVAVAALAFFIVEDDRKQRRLLSDLELRGIRRRSAGALAKPKASVGEKPARKRGA
jgi:heme exporter protein D